nr:EAL domain-containing protein [uncultured Undibacterium sp.]
MPIITQLPTNQTITSAQFAWLGRLAEASTPQETASLIVQCVVDESCCDTAFVSWRVESTDEQKIEPYTLLSPEEQRLIDAVVEHSQRSSTLDGSQIALPLFQGSPAVLVVSLTLDPAIDTQAQTEKLLDKVGALLQLAGQHMKRALASLDLQVAIADLERSERLQRALFAISDLAGSDHDMNDVLKGIHTIVGTLMYAENFFIVLHNTERDSIRFVYWADVKDSSPDPGIEIPMNSRVHSLTWYLLHDRKTLMGNNDQLQAQVSGPLKMIGTLAKDILGVPLLRDGLVLGAIVVQSYRDDISFSTDDRTLLEFVGSNILVALERKQGMEDLETRVQLRTMELADANRGLQQEIIERQRAERLHVALFHIAQLATADISQSELYSRVHTEVSELINAENFYIALLSKDGTTLEFPLSVDSSGEKFETRKIGRGLSEYVLNHGKVNFRSEDIYALEAAGEIDLNTVGISPSSWMGVPLLVGEQTIGLVAAQTYGESAVYTQADQELLVFVTSQIANTLHRRLAAESLQKANAELELRVQDRTQKLLEEISERERIQEQLKHEVMHDALTGLPNRGYILDRLTRVLAQLKRDTTDHCALLYLDIDRFKVINDSLGHLAGDEVLKEVARRLLLCVREPDVVARLSGDEFAVLLVDVKTPSTAIRVAQRIIDTLRKPLNVAGKEINPTASVGVAIIDDRYNLADEALRDADLALYRAKKVGRNRFELFDETLQKNAVNVLAIESELRSALQYDQFEPYFQPIIRLSTGETVGYEALIRWNHPGRGVIGPFDFLRIAEDNGSIEDIDWHMFELSCLAMTKLANKNTYLTINCSPLHFRRTDFDTRLLELLQRTGLSNTRLVTEVTEGSLLDDTERVCATLDRLRLVGVGAALDDFGTGYSSLSYLHKFPLRILKIDRSFVTELNSTNNSSVTVVAAILAMASALGLDVIAEGIETPEQHRTLVDMGCGFGQGYFLGRPNPMQHWLNLEK